MTCAIFLLALALAVPTTNLNSTCQSAKESALPGQDQASAFQSCVRDETTARDELKQKWGHYSASARENCAEPKGLSFSYVELLTCLEMQSGSIGNKPQMPGDAPSAPTPETPKP
jgi:hypothetical protein